MKINNNTPQKLDPYSQMQRLDNDPKAQAKNAQQAAAQPQGDRINLSSEALLHTTVHTAASNTPEIRQEKVNDIKERIASGSYNIDEKNIAKKLLQEEKLLGQTLAE